MEHITSIFIDKYTTELLNISKLDIEIINEIFVNNDLIDMPNYIDKFIYSEKSPFEFMGRLDYSELQRFLGYFNIYLYGKDQIKLVEFFKWIKCMSGIYPPKNSILENEIIYYFKLSYNDKQILLNTYNIKCIDTYNLLIKNNL